MSGFAALRNKAKFSAASVVFAGLVCAGAALYAAPATHAAAGGSAIPNLSPNDGTGWVPDRIAGDDFLPPEKGPGPVVSVKDHPYVPNNVGQSTFRVADLSNPILKPWAVEQM